MIYIDKTELPFNVIVPANILGTEFDQVGLATQYYPSLRRSVKINFRSDYSTWVSVNDVARCSFNTLEVGDTVVLAKTLAPDFTAGTLVVVWDTQNFKYTGEASIKNLANTCVLHKVSVFDTRTPEDWLKANPEFDKALNYFQTATSSKPTNPKDRAGENKTPIHLVPAEVIQCIAEALYEGSLKYGRENYLQAGVRYSTYYSATLRHLLAWFSGEDIDPDSGLEHLSKALASISVLYSAIHRGVLDNTDDRSVVQLNDPRITVARLNSKLRGNSDASNSNS